MLDVGQKSVLLGFVKPVNLIDKNDRAAACPPGFLGSGHDVFNLFNTRKHCAERDERGFRHPGDDPRQGSLADAWWSPEDHRWNLIALNRDPQRLPVVEQMALPDN